MHIFGDILGFFATLTCVLLISQESNSLNVAIVKRHLAPRGV